MTESDKILTIGIPAYNMEEYLPRCLDSVVNSKNIDKLDIIVVNDGSFDRTSEIAHLYEARYSDSVRVIDKPNGGWGTAINRSIKDARGKYYKSLDSDDWFITENLDKFIEKLDSIDADIVLTDYNEVNSEGEVREIKITGTKNSVINPDQYFPNVNFKKYSIHSVTYKLDFLTKIAFEVEPKYYADLDYVISPIKDIRKMFIVSLTIYQYYVGREGQSISLEGYNKHFEDYINVSRKLVSHLSTKLPYKIKQTLIVNVSSIVVDVYRFLMLNKYQRKNPKSKSLLKNYDSFLKKTSPEIYYNVGKRKGFGVLPYIKIWRLSGFNIFSIIRI